MSRGHMKYREVLKMPLPLFLYMVRFLDPTGILSLLQNMGLEAVKKHSNGKKKTLLPDLTTDEGQHEYEDMIDQAIARGNVR